MSPLKITFDFVRTRRYMENSYMYFKNANNYFHIFPYASGRFYGKTDVFPGGRTPAERALPRRGKHIGKTADLFAASKKRGVLTSSFNRLA